MKLFLNNKCVFHITNSVSPSEILTQLGLAPEEYYLLSDGKLVDKDDTSLCSDVHIVFKLYGGKGGFGSMLRAIGAQIEKTTNREACRDLSGRRLRDINEEQRLKNWISTQADREKETQARKKKKLERLCELPKHEFKDESYDQIRSSLPEQVEDAVTQGLKASCSVKRKIDDVKVSKKKKQKLWFDDELSASGSDTTDDDDSDGKHNEESAKEKESIDCIEHGTEHNDSLKEKSIVKIN